jgi:integrase
VVEVSREAGCRIEIPLMSTPSDLSSPRSRLSSPTGWVRRSLPTPGGGQVGPWKIEREIRRARVKVDGLPDGFRFHDLRYYYASLLIASGADVKVVQHRLHYASAKTTLDTYGHLWPDTDESTHTAVERVMSACLADSRRSSEALS